MKATVKVDGMHCGSCALNVDDALEEIEGITRSKTSFARARTKVEFDEHRVSLEQIRATIQALGYETRDA